MLTPRLLVLILVASLAAGAHAAKKDKTKGLPARSTIPEVDDKAYQDAKNKLALAQGRLERAQDALATLLKHRREEFESSPELSKAQAAIRDAQGEYDSAAGPILERVRGRPEHKSAVAAKQAAAKKVADLQQAEAPVPQDEIAAAAKAALDRGAAVSAIERAALDADPKVAAAKQKLAAANAKVLQLRRDFETSLKADPQVAGSRQEIEKFRADLGPLQSAYDAALQDYSRQVAAREKALHDDRPNTTDGGNANGKNGKPFKKKRKK